MPTASRLQPTTRPDKLTVPGRDHATRLIADVQRRARVQLGAIRANERPDPSLGAAIAGAFAVELAAGFFLRLGLLHCRDLSLGEHQPAGGGECCRCGGRAMSSKSACAYPATEKARPGSGETADRTVPIRG
jgi:hypothetical protein